LAISQFCDIKEYLDHQRQLERGKAIHICAVEAAAVFLSKVSLLMTLSKLFDLFLEGLAEKQKYFEQL